MAPAAHTMPQRGPLAPWRRPCGVRLFQRWGDCTRIAAACHVTPQAVSQWKQVPERHVGPVAALLGVTPDRLRPDLAQRKLTMTNVSLDPRDAAAALAQRDERTERATRDLEALHLSAQQLVVRVQFLSARLEEARLAHDQARADLRAKRSAITRAKRQMRDAGLPIPDFADHPDPSIPSPHPPSAAVGIGGVDSSNLKNVDRTPSKLSPPRNS